MGSNDYFEKGFWFKLPTILFVAYLILAAILLGVFFVVDADSKIGALAGGATVAAFFGIINLSLDYYNYLNTETLNKSGVKKFLTRRDDKSYYSELIDSASQEMKLLFETSNKFCEDFCSQGDGDDLLIKKLSVTEDFSVKMLIAKGDQVDEHARQRLQISRGALEEMQRKFPKQFEVRVYDHRPNHSIFLTEKDVIVGPYFPKLRGKNTHSVHFRSGSDFVGMYEKYFDEEWERAEALSNT